MSHLSLATLHLANTCPVVRIKYAMGCRVRWIWICVSDRTISGRSFARQVADHLTAYDGLHGSSSLLRWLLISGSRCLHVQEDVREVQLHLGRNSPRNPVLNTLHSPIFLKAQKGRYFGRPTEMGNKF